MALFHDDAIVLRRLDYSESSQVLLLFCRAQGPQRLIAKGIKRGTKTRYAVGVDLLELGKLVYSRRDGGGAQLGTLTEWRQVDIHAHVRRDLETWYAVQYAAETTAFLTEEGDPHPGLFDALRQLLEETQTECLDRLLVYLSRMLLEIGLQTELECCASCRRQPDAGGPIYFSAQSGGLLCRDCEGAAFEKFRIPGPAIAVLLRLRREDDIAIPPDMAPKRWRQARVAAWGVLDYQITQVMGRRPRLSQPLRDVLAAQAMNLPK